MSKLLEILGRAITVDVAELIWHWLNTVTLRQVDQPSSQTEHLERIIELAGDLKLHSAEEQLRLYLFDNPTCFKGRMAAAAIYIHKNMLKNAVEELKSVYLRQPNNTMALYALGYCHERLGNQADAIEFYQDCLKFKNYLQLPRQRLAAIYFKNRQIEKTTFEYELLKKEYPDDISCLVSLGHLYMAQRLYDKAIETFSTAILINPDNFQSKDTEEIDLMIQDGRFHEALDQIEDLQQQNCSVDLMMKKADIFNMLGQTSQAVSQYQQILNICPDFLEATIKLATQYLNMHQEQLAAQHFNRALELNEQIIDAYMGLASAYKLADNNADALATLSLASALQPNSSLLFTETASLQFTFNLGYSCNVTDPEKLMEAVIAAHKAEIAVKSGSPDLHYRLGILMMGSNWLPKAIEAFKTALSLNPTHNRAQSKLAACLFDIGCKEQALDLISTPDCIDKETLNMHYETALLYCDRVKFASSMINLEHHMENNFASPADAAVNISIVLQNLGLLDRAVAMWDNLADTACHAAINRPL